MSIRWALRLALLPICCASAVLADEPGAPDRRYRQVEASRDGTGKLYMGREIAQVMGHQGADWLERPDRASLDRPDALVEALALEPTDVVADIGAGTGYFSFRLAEEVPMGRVLAVDIQPEMLERIELRKRLERVERVETILGGIEDPALPKGAADLALLVDAYHEFSHPREMIDGIVAGLRPGGRLVLVEYRAEDPAIRIKPLHKMSEAQVRKELAAAGLRWKATLDVLPRQHVLIFHKPIAAP